MLFDRQNWPPHYPWVIGVVLGTIAAVGWFAAASVGRADWPGGSTCSGFTFGILGGGIILFEFFLWVRKRYFRVWRLGTAQAWLRAHIWLGMFCLPILILHSGLRFGGTLSTVLMVLLILVVASGVFGVVLQNLIPKRMLDEIPAETIYSQMDYLVKQMLTEADRLVTATCGVKTQTQEAEAPREEAGPIVIGAVRTVENVQGKVLGTRVPATPVPESEALATFYTEKVVPFLLKGSAQGSPLSNPRQAAVVFQNIRTELPPATHETIAVLESLCEQRRQWETQARMHWWLHSWLCVHFPLSVALVVLMLVHVFVTLKYW